MNKEEKADPIDKILYRHGIIPAHWPMELIPRMYGAMQEYATTQNSELQKEVERLREVLQKIAENEIADVSCFGVDRKFVFACSNMIYAAKQALSQPNK